MKELFLALLTFVSSLFLILALVVLGWFLVWRYFLSRFRFVRELLNNADSSDADSTPRNRPKKSRRD